MFIIVRPERVGTDHFTKVTSLVGKGADLGPHFMQDDRNAHLCSLPSGLGSGHAATDDMKYFAHGQDLGDVGGLGKRERAFDQKKTGLTPVRSGFAKNGMRDKLELVYTNRRACAL